MPLSPTERSHVNLKVNDFLASVWIEGIRKLHDEIRSRFSYDPCWMIDGKWSDIPNTVANYVKRLEWLNVAYYTVHGSGWTEMIRAAKQSAPNTKLLAITLLTSMKDNEMLRIYGTDRQDILLRIAKSSLFAWADGLVCAPTDAPLLRSVFWEDILLVTPNISREGKGRNDDQNKALTATPLDAIKNGATDIVVGRPILNDENPLQVITEIIHHMESAGREIPTTKSDFVREKLIYMWEWSALLEHIGALYARKEDTPFVRLASGFLSDGYINFGSTERDYRIVDRACHELAHQLRERDINGDIVIWAQMGSVRISLPLAKVLGISTSIYTEKEWDGMKLKRHDLGSDWFRGKKVLLSEDVITTGSTLRKMIEEVRNGGWQVIAITSVVNRSGKGDFEGIPLISCYSPPPFSKWWDQKTLETIWKNAIEVGKNPEEIDNMVLAAQHETPLPTEASISEKPKNEWNNLISAMNNQRI